MIARHDIDMIARHIPFKNTPLLKNYNYILRVLCSTSLHQILA